MEKVGFVDDGGVDDFLSEAGDLGVEQVDDLVLRLAECGEVSEFVDQYPDFVSVGIFADGDLLDHGRRHAGTE